MYCGFDVGGSKTALGIFNQERRLRWEKRVATPKGSYEGFLQAVEALVHEADERFDQQGSVKIGISGMSETADDTLYAANVPTVSDRSLHIDLNTRLEHDVRLDNDASCSALSEARDDEFTRHPLVMELILGTGVGDGLVLSGRSIAGHSHIIGGLGHIHLPVSVLGAVGRDFPLLRCGCGQLGCIEDYLSGHGFIQLYEHLYQRPLSSLEVAMQWQQHNSHVQVHAKCYLDLLTVCLGNILTIVDPDLLVLGGGLSSLVAISEGLTQRLSYHFPSAARVPRTEHVRHGDVGGMRGAAFLHLTH